MAPLAALIPAAMAAAGTVGAAATAAAPTLTAIGTVAGVGGAIQQGLAGAAASRAQGKEDQLKANNEMTVALQKSQAEQRKKENLLSTQRAIAGASGGGVGGTAAEISGDTEAQGDLNSQLELWQGKERAAGYTDEANMKMYDAKQQTYAIPFNATSKLVSGVTDYAKLYPPQPNQYRYGS